MDLSTLAKSASNPSPADVVTSTADTLRRDSASYRVSLNMSCTDTQLEKVVTALVRTGAYVNVQIEQTSKH